VVTACTSTVLLTAHPGGADTVASAQAKAAAIEASLTAAQNRMSALGQQYDAAQAKLTQVNSNIASTKVAITKTKNQVTADKRTLERAAIANYVSDGAATNDDPLFSQNEKTSGAAAEYNQIASGDLTEAVDNLDTAESKLSAQQAQLTTQQGEAQGAVSSEQAAVAANEQVEQQQSAALAQENGEIATLVQQQQQAAAAQAAQAAQDKIAAAVAAQAKVVAAQRVAVSTPIGASANSSSSNASTSGGSSRGTSSAPAPYTPVPVAPGGGGAVAAAESQLGVPYVWGGETPGVGFVCSGLVQWAWRQAGVNLPRTSGAQFAATTPVSIADLEPGDLLFYGPDGSDHVAMYVGGNTMIEAPETGEVVHLTPLRFSGYGGVAVALRRTGGPPDSGQKPHGASGLVLLIKDGGCQSTSVPRDITKERVRNVAAPQMQVNVALPRETRGPVKLQGVSSTGEHGLASDRLSDVSSAHRSGCFALDARCRVIHCSRCSLQSNRHINQPVLDRLEFADGSPKLTALRRIVDTFRNKPTRASHHVGRKGDRATCHQTRDEVLRDVLVLANNLPSSNRDATKVPRQVSGLRCLDSLRQHE
jgi:cell wall-associated NlpC family hydrolase